MIMYTLIPKLRNLTARTLPNAIKRSYPIVESFSTKVSQEKNDSVPNDFPPQSGVGDLNHLQTSNESLIALHKPPEKLITVPIELQRAVESILKGRISSLPL